MANLPLYLQVLNPQQREAVLHEGGPLLILAGAGSGKTRVITTKIAYLIRERGVEPRSILAVTFTNKAAAEMRERAQAIDERARDAMLRTFHSFGAWFLRRHGEAAGLPASFVIYDDEDSAALLGTLAPDKTKVELRQLAHRIARAKDYFLDPESPDLDLIDHTPGFRALYAAYQKRLGEIGNVDFGDLIKKPVEILRANPALAERLRRRFRVIMVDEYQDANIAQFEMLRELYGDSGGRRGDSPGEPCLPSPAPKPLSSGRPYICVVGDDDQSIYRFRGAEVRNILEFAQRFGGDEEVTQVRLERNYRSTQEILSLAHSVVSRNEGRLGKRLVAEKGTGAAPEIVFVPDQDVEAKFCAELVSRAAAAGSSYDEWAILYRTNAQSVGFESEFLRRQIPYRVVGSLKFYEREEVKDALALLSFLVNRRDEIAFRRVVNKPARGVGPAAVNRIVDAAVESGLDLEAAARKTLPSLSKKAAAGVQDFLAALAEGEETLAGGDALTERRSAEEGTLPLEEPSEAVIRGAQGLAVCVAALVEAAGIAAYHQANDEIQGEQRLANLQELVNGATLYEASRAGLLDFLEHIELDRSLAQEESAEAGAVTLITVHNTKGLEWKRVVITGLEQGLFPRDGKDSEEIEEERRLFYVGVTRAMDELHLTSCAQRRIFGRTAPMAPSLFLLEADKTGVIIKGSSPYGFAGREGREQAGERAERSRQRGGWGAGAPRRQTSSDGRWTVGDGLFSDDHGYGEVSAISEEREYGPVITARFQTGREQKFYSRTQSGRFMKVSCDD